MGRAGRGGGGGFGGSRGSGFGGSRGFGSHSGGSSSHRSGYSGGSSSHRSSYSGGSRNSSYHRHYNSGPRFYYFGGSRYSNSRYSGGYSSIRGGGLFSKIIGSRIFWLIVIGSIIFSAISDGYSKNWSNGSSGTSITSSTVNRERLESTTLKVTDYTYHDDLDWITNPTKLKDGMYHFFELTGVQPFLYITDDVGAKGIPTDAELEEFGNKIYDKYFEDEAHLLVVFYEKDEKYRSFYITGTEAKTVIDDEAGEILLDYIDHYYYSNYDESEFFGRSFSEAADRIMRKTESPFFPIAVLVIITVIVVVLFSWWKKRKKHRLEEMKKAKDILDSDLNEFGGSDYTGYGSGSSVDDLKKKYDNM